MSDARSALRRLTSDPTQLQATCLDHGVALVTAFGSVLAAAGEPKDLDLGVLFDRGLPSHDILGLIGALTDITGFDGWDIMALNSAGAVARERALIGSTVLFE
jgi:predicted nucleotidyltransferase